VLISSQRFGRSDQTRETRLVRLALVELGSGQVGEMMFEGGGNDGHGGKNEKKKK
jgi:hypothetical protein